MNRCTEQMNKIKTTLIEFDLNATGVNDWDKAPLAAYKAFYRDIKRIVG